MYGTWWMTFPPPRLPPPRDRERLETELRAALRKEWQLAQDSIKSEPLAITYSYWNGTGHRWGWVAGEEGKKGAAAGAVGGSRQAQRHRRHHRRHQRPGVTE